MIPDNLVLISLGLHKLIIWSLLSILLPIFKLSIIWITRAYLKSNFDDHI